MRAHEEMNDAPGLRVLLVGAGGRDHALCRTFARSPRLRELHAVPGNAGIADVATCHPSIALDDVDGMVALAIELQPDLVVIGPEDLLVGGLASRIAAAGITCLGPDLDAARLEGSKSFAKQLMERAGVATPPWRACDTPEAARRAVVELGGAVAVKADGLAAGCGAYVCPTPERADAAIDELMVARRFGSSGDRVIVEQLVTGAEASVMALVDGEHVVPLPAARDYKRLHEGDAGPNTGGMGAHAPSFDIDPDEAAQLARATIQPVIDELRAAGTPFRGVVYAGVMLTPDGPSVLEYNCRFGNPETQALVRVLEDGTDLLDLLHRAATGRLAGVDAVHAHGAAVAVCVAAANYPELQLEPAPVTVTGMADAAAVPGVEVFYGFGSELVDDGAGFRAAGGRVVTISGWGEDLTTAVARAYEAVDAISMPDLQVRRDIGGGVRVRAARD